MAHIYIFLSKFDLSDNMEEIPANLELLFVAAFILDIFIGYRLYMFLKKHIMRLLRSND